MDENLRRHEQDVYIIGIPLFEKLKLVSAKCGVFLRKISFRILIFASQASQVHIGGICQDFVQWIHHSGWHGKLVNLNSVQ